MKVNCYKTIDLEFEADVETDDVLNSFREIISESEGKHVKGLTVTLDVLTRILALVSDENIASLSREARGIIGERLATEAARYS